MPSTTDFTGPISILNQNHGLVSRLRRAATVTGSPKATRTLRFIRRFNTTKASRISVAATSGTCAPPDTGCKTRRRSRLWVRRSIRTKWASPDPACLVYRLSQKPSASLSVPGIRLRVRRRSESSGRRTSNMVCSTPGPAPYQLIRSRFHLSQADRGQSNSTYDQFRVSVASYESSPEVSPFSREFDYRAGKRRTEVLSRDELAGLEPVPRQSHVQYVPFGRYARATAKQRTPAAIAPANAASVAPPIHRTSLRTTSESPRNPAVPYYSETQPDQYPDTLPIQPVSTSSIESR